MGKVTLLRDRYADIPDLRFYGQFSASPSGEWYICWADCDLEFHSGLGGCRDSGHGLYVLYNKFQDRIVLVNKLERPQRAKVIDTGVFSIEDWCFGDQRKSKIYVISPTGENLINKTFNGNMFNSDISASGNYLACQTAHNQNSSDGNLLTIFDIFEKKELFSKNPVTGWADEYVFVEDAPKFGVLHKDIGTYYYDINGNFLDEERYDEEQLSCNKYEIVILKAQDVLKSSDLDIKSAQKVINAIKHALDILPKGEHHYVSWAALAFKIQGVAYEFLGNKVESLYSFEKALELNPKIGVKKKIDKLRKILG